jgi:hypothetical protein
VYKGYFTPALSIPEFAPAFVVFLVIASIAGVKWKLSVFLACICFMNKVVEHFFLYLLAICTSSENDSSIHLAVY